MRFNNQSLSIIPRTQVVNTPTPLERNTPPGGIKKFKFGLNKDVSTLPTNTYVQPDGISLYFQPNGISLYFQPAPPPPTPSALSYTYTVTSTEVEGDYRMLYEYFIVTAGRTAPWSPGPWGIALGWQGDYEAYPGNIYNFSVAGLEETGIPNDFFNRILSIVNTINENQIVLGYTATFIVGNSDTGSFIITPTNNIPRYTPVASIGTWTITA